MNKQRLLFSTPVKCPFQCEYCFADMAEYQPQPRLEEGCSVAGVNVVYPSCDGELLITRPFVELVESVKSGRGEFTAISLSTKSNPKPKVLEKIQRFNEELQSTETGFIKLSVSMSTKNMIGEIEPGTASYEERLQALSHIDSRQIPVSVNLKPMLPFIEYEEYREILNDTFGYCSHYLLGGLYFSENSDFFEKYIKGQYLYSFKTVEWLDARPMWPYIENKELIQKLSEHIVSQGCFAFDSDVELINHLGQPLSKGQFANVGTG